MDFSDSVKPRLSIKDLYSSHFLHLILQRVACYTEPAANWLLEKFLAYKKGHYKSKIAILSYFLLSI